MSLSLQAKGLHASSFTRALKKLIPVDGNAATVNVAYNMSEASFLFPITPSTPMGEQYDSWTAQGRKNVFDRVPVVRVLQSEGGAAGALHGAASVGTLCTTFTASQGLLLMIPNMLKTAGERWPLVFHVASRAVSTQALSIQGDHADIMCVKNTGFSFLASSTVQECQDLAAIAHMSTVDAEIPFVHFFEGFKLSHEIDSIEPLSVAEMKQLMPYQKLEEIRKRSLNPAHPMVLGHSQGADAYFQTVELGNKQYEAIPDIVEKNFEKFAKLTGRKYKIFDYYGHPDAEDVIVMMGAGAPSVKECIDLMPGQKVGLVIPHLYRPWSMERFIKALPKSVKRISVLDRSKDPAAAGEPLFMDVAFTLNQMGHPAKCYGGRYGLASREFSPLHAKAVFDNMRSEKPKRTFTVGINDDVTFLSLPMGKLEGFNKGNKMSQAIFWGLGGDGTIGANKAAIKTTIDEKGMYAQGTFAYSADKSNGLTRSYLRFSDKPITAQYTITAADFVGCTLGSYVSTYNMVGALKEGGKFFLNFPWTDIEGVSKNLPAEMKRSLYAKKAQLYVIDASKLARDVGLRNKISTIIQACFYHLSGVLGDNWLPLTEKWIDKEFGRLGDDVINKNKTAAREAVKHLKKLEIPESWKDAVDPPGAFAPKHKISFIKEQTHPEPTYKAVLDKAHKVAAAGLPVSAFKENFGGVSPVENTKWLKKGLSISAPKWNPDTCVQCNACSAICPHSVIRPFLLTNDEINKAPKEFKDSLKTIKANGKELKGLNYRIQASPYDCVDCELCATICPTKSISMTLVSGDEKNLEYAKHQNDLFVYLTDMVPNRGGLLKDKFNTRNSQFQLPQMEFPGSCQGCNETLVTKIVTQLFGKRMMIANASGCSSVWGGAFSKVPFVRDEHGRGPAWARSLFEDNAEFGFGMTVGLEMRRKQLHDDVGALLKERNLPARLARVLRDWYDHYLDGEYTMKIEQTVLNEVAAFKDDPKYACIQDKKDLWVKTSQWILGGDGWAYDIGYGGLDHIFASGKDFNVLVFDNEIYANTGGQQSKATQLGAVAQFAACGKDTAKKDLGFMMMGYGNVYVASVTLGSQKDLQYLIKCLKEAESFPGPSLILCYCNCIMHHIKGAVGAGGKGGLKAHKLAVEGGYWPVYSYDPRRKEQGKNPLEYLSPQPDEEKLDEFLNMEVRFNSLKKINPEVFAELRRNLHADVMERHRKYKLFAQPWDKK